MKRRVRVFSLSWIVVSCLLAFNTQSFAGEDQAVRRPAPGADHENEVSSPATTDRRKAERSHFSQYKELHDVVSKLEIPKESGKELEEALVLRNDSKKSILLTEEKRKGFLKALDTATEYRKQAENCISQHGDKAAAAFVHLLDNYISILKQSFERKAGAQFDELALSAYVGSIRQILFEKADEPAAADLDLIRAVKELNLVLGVKGPYNDDTLKAVWDHKKAPELEAIAETASTAETAAKKHEGNGCKIDLKKKTAVTTSDDIDDEDFDTTETHEGKDQKDKKDKRDKKDKKNARHDGVALPPFRTDDEPKSDTTDKTEPKQDQRPEDFTFPRRPEDGRQAVEPDGQGRREQGDQMSAIRDEIAAFKQQMSDQMSKSISDHVAPLAQAIKDRDAYNQRIEEERQWREQALNGVANEDKNDKMKQYLDKLMADMDKRDKEKMAMSPFGQNPGSSGGGGSPTTPPPQPQDNGMNNPYNNPYNQMAQQPPPQQQQGPMMPPMMNNQQPQPIVYNNPRPDTSSQSSSSSPVTTAADRLASEMADYSKASLEMQRIQAQLAYARQMSMMGQGQGQQYPNAAAGMMGYNPAMGAAARPPIMGAAPMPGTGLTGGPGQVAMVPGARGNIPSLLANRGASAAGPSRSIGMRGAVAPSGLARGGRAPVRGTPVR